MQLLSFGLLLFGLLCGAFALIGWLPLIERDMRLDAVGVAFFVVLGGVAYAAGAAIDRWVKPPAPKTWRLEPGNTRFIGAMLVGAARLQLLFGLSLLVLDAGWLVLTLTQMPSAEDRRASPGYPMVPVVISLVFIVIFAFVALLSLYAAYRMRSPIAWHIHAVLTKAPERLTRLTITRIRKAEAPGDIGQRFLAEIHAGPEDLTIVLSAKHAALLKQYVQLHAPQATLSEIDQEF